MEAVKKLFARVLGRIPIKGTLTTTSGDESNPVAISNEIMGGPFIVNNVDEMKEIFVERMVKGCKCTVNEYDDAGETIPTRTYILKTIPSERLSDMTDPNISDYWILDRPQQQAESSIESQYAADYNGQKPPFLPNILSKEAYNAGYASQADYDSGDTSLIIWSSTYDPQVHTWVRQRTGSLAYWGIPIKVDDGYSEGKYADVRFQWRATNLGEPARPQSMVDGFPNNSPDGWFDTPAIPGGIDYDIYITTNTLWRISATKGAYGDLLSEWTDPVVVSTDPQLVRYGVDANNNEYLNDIYWRSFYSAGDKFRASRITTGDPWIVERITGESGEYIDYVFKEFQDDYTPLPSDAPQTVLGYGTNGWRDGVFTAQPGYTLYVSTSRKFSDGTISENWTTPARYDGKSTFRCVIEPSQATGYAFKYSHSGGNKVVTPASIKLVAKLYQANEEVDPAEFTSVQWYKGTPDTGTLVPILPVGTEPNRNAQISGTNNNNLEIFPENITGTQTYTAKITFKGLVYIDPINVIDLTDGLGYAAIIESNGGFTYKGSSTKTFTAKLYENGVDISSNSDIVFTWNLGGNDLGTGTTKSISDTSITGLENLILTATFKGNDYIRTEALTDIADGKSLERQYTSTESIDLNHTPDTPGNPANWSTDSTDAVWVIERLTGDSSWGVPYRVKGEKGTPFGAFQKTVYRTRNAGDTPTWLGQRPTANTTPSSSLIPSGWSETPEANAPTGSEIWAVKATFTKNPANESIDEIVANWNITGLGWSMPFKVTHFPAAGANGDPGTDGTNGWSIVPAIETYGDSNIVKVKSWTGGTGQKPVGEGYYIGSNGLVSSANQAVNIRGLRGLQGLKGDDGVFNPEDYWEDSIVSVGKLTGQRNRYIYFYLAKNGLVYYFIRTLSFDSNTDVTFTFTGDVAAKMLPIGWTTSSNYQFGLPTMIDVLSENNVDANIPSEQFTITPQYNGFKLFIYFANNRLYTAHGSYLSNSVAQL